MSPVYTNKSQRLHTLPNFHKKLVPKQTRISVLQFNNFSLVSIRFSVPWFIVLSVWVSAVYAKYVSTPIHPAEFPQKISSQTNQELIIFVWYSYVFSVPWFIVLSPWVSAVYAKYVSTPIHPAEFPQKNQFSNKPGFRLS